MAVDSTAGATGIMRIHRFNNLHLHVRIKYHKYNMDIYAQDKLHSG